MRLLKTIRLDRSDEHIFSSAAPPGEWAVSGAFVFADEDPERLVGKQCQAFVHGFLGTASFGWSTLVSVAEIGVGQYEDVVAAFAQHLLPRFGAPDLAAGRAVAARAAAVAR